MHDLIDAQGLAKILGKTVKHVRDRLIPKAGIKPVIGKTRPKLYDRKAALQRLRE